ncbi:g3219 [Coccomyxa viridis]|uniref:G3219 protein n=1 Tax=Coccomyxa viridis TaxID=1274662 RepID=A0ABP1FMA3_9CHLO
MQLTGSFCGSQAAFQPRTQRGCAERVARSVLIRAQAEPQAQVARRTALSLLSGAAFLLSRAGESEAAFGDAARVFGSKPTNTTGFYGYGGEGFSLLLPSQWNPSKEREEPGVVLRYEDNGDSLNNVVVVARKSDKNSIEGYGSPDDFLNKISPLLGEQVFSGATRSEGGFAANKVQSASLLDASVAKDKNGKSYYKYELLTRTADGNEGGRHQLLTATVGNGNLYICKVQIGDKRWFKGAEKFGKGTINSFVVA